MPVVQNIIDYMTKKRQALTYRVSCSKESDPFWKLGETRLLNESMRGESVNVKIRGEFTQRPTKAMAVLKFLKNLKISFIFIKNLNFDL